MFKNTYKKHQKHGQILGVSIASSNQSQLLEQITKKLTAEANLGKFFITTPNPEIVLKAQDDLRLREILNKADFSVPDGIGLKIFGNSKLNIYPGRKLMLDIIRVCEENGLPVFLLGGSKSSNREAILSLQAKYPDLSVMGDSGAKYNTNANPDTDLELKAHFDTVARINKFKPSIIFVALGCPKQEYWIDKYLPLLNSRSAMTVGGAIDYLSGKASLPPVWMEKFHLEWLWRLLSEPERAGRILAATAVFPFSVLFSKFEIKR